MAHVTMDEGIYDDWNFLDEDNNDEDSNGMRLARRPYKMPVRQTINDWDDADFFQRFRLTKPTFLMVLQLIAPEIQHPHPRTRYLTPEQKLLITLRFMASGSMQLVVADVVHVSASSVCNVLPKVCMALIAHLRKYVKMPTTSEERETTAAQFFNLGRIPRTIGAIDCTHVKIQSPGGQLSEVFRNRKGFFSLNVQTISTPDLKIADIVARWAGSVHDQTIFRQSNICARFEAGEFNDYILIADSGYANTSYLATPFTENNREIRHNPHMQAYQTEIIRARNVVERQYGLLKRRFPMLAYGVRLKVETTMKMITASAILHNIAIDARDGLPPGNIDIEEQILDDDHQNQPDILVNPRRRQRLARDVILAQF